MKRFYIERTSGGVYGVFDRLRIYGGGSGCVCMIDDPELAQAAADSFNALIEEKKRKAGPALGHGSLES